MQQQTNRKRGGRPGKVPGAYIDVGTPRRRSVYIGVLVLLVLAILMLFTYW